jgi:hypothetical protein
MLDAFLGRPDMVRNDALAGSHLAGGLHDENSGHR